MSKEINFGIGCFHFGIRKEAPFEFKGSDYLIKLKEALSKIANLDNLKIVADKDFENETDKITEALPNLDEDRSFFPCPSLLDIDFELYIPFRIQAELCDTEEKFLQTYSERFKVKIFQSYYLPVTIIETINPSKENDPSNAVRIVREFLEKQLTIEKSEYIRFECLGPSPFHLDCFVKPKEPEGDSDWFIEPEVNILRGYDEIIFYYNSVEIANAEEAFNYLKDSIEDEFGFFYNFIKQRNQRMFEWETIQTSLQELQDIQSSKGFKAFFNRLFNRPSLIGKLFTELGTFEANDIFINRTRQNEYNDIYKAKDEMFFKIFIDKEFEEKNEYPIKQITELVKFYENRRVKSVEFMILIIAASLGGTIGALLTFLFQMQKTATPLGH